MAHAFILMVASDTGPPVFQIARFMGSSYILAIETRMKGSKESGSQVKENNDVHVVLNNVSSRKPAEIKEWLKRHPRWRKELGRTCPILKTWIPID